MRCDCGVSFLGIFSQNQTEHSFRQATCIELTLRTCSENEIFWVEAKWVRLHYLVETLKIFLVAYNHFLRASNSKRNNASNMCNIL